MHFLFRPIRDLPIGFKLGASILGALAMLCGLAWFALDRMEVLGRFQEEAAARVTVERRVRESLLTTMEMRVVTASLPNQQTVARVKDLLDQAGQLHARATDGLAGAREKIAGADDIALLDQARASLDRTWEVVKSLNDLRRDMLISRQKNLFQSRPAFENALNTLITEIGAGEALRGGVESVREAGAGASDAGARGLNATGMREVMEYRLAISRVLSGAIMYMATNNGGAANDVRDSAAAADKGMAALLGSGLAEEVKAGARTVDTLGRGISQAALTLLEQTKRLEDMRAGDMGRATAGLRSAMGALLGSLSDRVNAAAAQAAAGRAEARTILLRALGGVAVLMTLTGLFFTRLVAGPITRLTREVKDIAEGRTSYPVEGTDRGDEAGAMARAVETLRGVMRQTFVQARMIQDMPVGVMTAEAAGENRITYMNREAGALMEVIRGHLPVSPAELEGQNVSLFDAVAGKSVIVTDAAALPHRARLVLGAETLELSLSALRDPNGAYVGPMLIWRRLTEQARLAERFEQSIGSIAHAVSEAASGMRESARGMSEASCEAGQRTLAVTEASGEAAGHVAAASSGAEELAASVSEIGRQVAESARIAARAVTEARATDRSVSGLSEAAGRIGEVVELISDIAGRTNLLALNATIEAARAGEAGRGFAVVAGEVKTLATQTAKATEGITAQIASMRDATGQAVAALRGIGETIERMNEIAVAIAGAVEQQGAATRDIASAVQQAARGTADVNENIGVVSQAVNGTGERAGTVLRAATALTGQADELKSEVTRFLREMQRAA